MKKLFETASSSEKNNEQVDKMAEAARALRWSERIVEAKRVQSITEMQIQTMDHMMDARGEPIKLPDPKTASPPALLSKLKSYCRALARPAVVTKSDFMRPLYEWGETLFANAGQNLTPCRPGGRGRRS
jgi:hypothetical protein